MGHYTIPIKFEEVKNVLDDRFIKVKIYLAHTGENRNGSIFSKEVLESMIPSLSNVPILGYIALNDAGDKDFREHNEDLVIEGGKFTIKYKGHAWGTIPEDNNARFEMMYGEDGVEREYLVAEGLLWKKFPEVEEIFDRDGGYKSQSMEIFPPSAKGYVNEHGLFVFTEAKFEGACILGEDVTPAMISSRIEKFSMADNIKQELSEMLREFNQYYSSTKGDKKLENQTNEPENLEPEATEPNEPQATEPEATPEPTEPETEFSAEPETTETVATEPEEPEVPEPLATEPEASAEPEQTADPVAEPEEPTKFSVTRTFEMEQSDVRGKLYDKIDDHMRNALSLSQEEAWFYIVGVYQTYVVVSNESYRDEQFYKVGMEVTDEDVILKDVEQVFPMFLNANEKQAVEASRTSIELLQQEVNTLKTFKEGVELSEKIAKIDTYASVLNEEQIETIKSQATNFSLVDIEKEIGFLLLKNNHFSANQQAEQQVDPARSPIATSNENFQYGDLARYFKK